MSSFNLAAAPGRLYTLSLGPGGGEQRSDDQGRTWRRAAPGLGETVINQIALDPIDPSILYAATFGGGVLRLEQSE